jgi:nuclear migration protein JNM1
LPTSTAYSDTSDTEANPSISKTHLQPNNARSQFQSSRVDARDTDFSDRVSSKRRAYVVSNREQDKDGDDYDSEDEDESLQRKLARLNREMLEVQNELDKRKTEFNGTQAHPGDEDMAAQLAQLSTALDGMRQSQSAQARLSKHLPTSTSALSKADAVTVPESTRQEETTKDTSDTQALNKVADFDARLAILERQLGITSLDTPETSTTDSSFTPILPTLSLLDRQLALLTSSSSASHIDTLAQKLLPPASTEPQQDSQSPDDMAKLRALYALLPTLTSLSPTLPPLLTRLRSLRTLHANAVTASQTLDEVEQRQDEAGKEIREWREGLKKVEEAVARAESGMLENSSAVESWVKELEERVKRLD